MSEACRPAVSDIFDVKWLKCLLNGDQGVALLDLGLGEGEAEDDGMPFDARRRLRSDDCLGFDP